MPTAAIELEGVVKDFGSDRVLQGVDLAVPAGVARDLADYVVLMHEGRIVASGEAEAVLESDEPFVRQFVSGATAGPLQLRDPG